MTITEYISGIFLSLLFSLLQELLKTIVKDKFCQTFPLVSFFLWNATTIKQSLSEIKEVITKRAATKTIAWLFILMNNKQQKQLTRYHFLRQISAKIKKMVSLYMIFLSVIMASFDLGL